MCCQRLCGLYILLIGKFQCTLWLCVKLYNISHRFVLFVKKGTPNNKVCKDNSNIEIQKGVNCLSINALLACKRCPLSPLLTPFWSPIKHLFCIAFVTN